MGSSLLARGISENINNVHSVFRLIPAGAGHIFSTQLRRKTHSAHPRWRGAYAVGEAPFDARKGSSPLARGICRSRRWKNSTRRLIPAGAGHIKPSHPATWTPAAHPRWRGAYGCPTTLPPLANGSSPLARGILIIIHGDFRMHRLIPAGAGHMLDDLHLQQDSARFTFNSE